MCDGIPIIGSLFKAISPSAPKLPKAADPSIAREKAAEAASVADTERRRKVAAGGRQATLLAGRQVAEEQQRKTLLGQ